MDGLLAITQYTDEQRKNIKAQTDKFYAQGGLCHLVETIVIALVDHPMKVRVDVLVDHPMKVRVDVLVDHQGMHTVTVRVDPSDLGKVIGKQGRTARSLRTIVGAFAMREKMKVTLNIIEEQPQQN